MRRRWLMFLVIAVATSSLVGCSDPGFPTAKLEGQVTVDGKPIPDGVIGFVPLDAKRGRGVTGKIHAGHYAVSEVPQGNVRVYLTAVGATGRMLDYMGSQIPEQISLIPPRYSSGIDSEVRGDDSNQDFRVTSQ